MTTAGAYERVLLALCLWREARGCDQMARCGVKHVILNRAKASGKSIADVILAPRQFSSFNWNDPNSTKLPAPGDQAWRECCALVDTPQDDPTRGATHYHSPMENPPAWALADKITTRIGPFTFYRI